MSLLLNYLKKYWKLVAIALILASINQIFSMLDPWIFRHIIDNYATKFLTLNSHQFVTGVLTLLLASMGVNLISRIAKSFQDFYLNTITQRLGARIYSDGLAHSLELPYQVFEDQRSGETLGILQKVRTDTQAIIQQFVGTIFTSLIGFVFVTVYAITINWIIAPIFILTVPILATVSLVLSRRIKTIQKDIVAQTTALAGTTTESLRNIELVKSLGLANQEVQRLNGTTEQILQLELKKVKYTRGLTFVQGTVVNFLRTAILFVLLYLIFQKTITFGQFFSLYIYSFFIFQPLQDLGSVINTYRETQVSLNNFENILNTPKEPRAAQPINVGAINKLSFDHVTFKHLSASTAALNDVSFAINTGETIAFVGPSGSGKTTMVKLLVGLYRPLSGKVLYNDVDETKIDLDSLRNQIGLVTQDTQLFAGTIRDNLLFVNPGASDEQCMTVLKKAAADSLLARANKGLDTLIGEGGVKVSGGEKQRLSIARALLRNPNILVFDEATSALDSLTEEEITSTIRELSGVQKRMTILIAHRLSTIMHADKIFVLEKGNIIESGAHDYLLNLKGLYYAMWRQQIGEKKTERATMPVWQMKQKTS